MEVKGRHLRKIYIGWEHFKLGERKGFGELLKPSKTLIPSNLRH